MSKSLIQTTGRGLYSPIENKHKEIRWIQSNSLQSNSDSTVYGLIGNTTYFAIDQYPDGYVVRHFVNRTVDFHGKEKHYKTMSTAKSICTKLLRNEILKLVIMLDNLADIKNIE